MNAQGIFDKVFSHLLKQNARSTAVGGGSCCYRSYQGLMCAVGCLISDSEYCSEMEGESATMLLENFPQVQHLAPHVNLLQALQRVHDCNEPRDWPEALRWVAQKFNLTFTEPE